MAYLKNELPPAVIKDPLADHEYLRLTPVSKGLLPGFFRTAGSSLTKNEYYQVAGQMKPEEIPLEVVEKLDSICEIFELAKHS